MFSLSNLVLINSFEGNKKDVTMMIKTKYKPVLSFTDGYHLFFFNYRTGIKLKEVTIKGCKEFFCMYVY